ncbi:MAG: fibronectin type III domain-containing protein [Candidatus Margulisiibacteriota bacterium]
MEKAIVNKTKIWLQQKKHKNGGYLPLLITASILIVFFANGCSTSPVVTNSATSIIQSLTISPEAVAPNSFISLSLDAFDTEGNKMFYRLGTGETLALDQNKNIVIQAPGDIGTAEIDLIVTNGRQDIFNKIKIRVDDTLPASTIRYGRATLSFGKSFDFFSGTVVDQCYGDMDYAYYYGNNNFLTFGGDRNGNYDYSDSFFDGGLISLTASNENIKDLNQVPESWAGLYYKFGDERISDADSKLKVGSVYCFLLKYENNFYGKFKIISFDDEKIVFDWVFQKTPGEKRFYDYAPSVLATNPPAAPTGLIATAKSSTEVILSWEAVNETDILGYQVYRSITNNKDFSKISSVGKTTTCVDTGLQAGITYHYKVKGIDSAYNESGYSSEIMVKTPSPEAIFSDGAENGASSWEVSGFSVSGTKAHNGDKSFYSGEGSNLNNLFKFKMPILISGTDILHFWVWYSAVTGHDYLKVEISEDGNNWISIKSYTGGHPYWSQENIELGSYSGKTLYLRFKYITDWTYSDGFYLDDITIER